MSNNTEKQEEIKLRDLPEGSLFKHNNTFALKTEYRTDNGAIEAFIIGSGEMFWGGTSTAEDQGNLIVHPLPSPAAPAYPRWKELLDWIDEQKRVAQQGYVKAEDEESRTMYSSENITYSLVIDKIKALMYESPSPEVNDKK